MHALYRTVLLQKGINDSKSSKSTHSPDSCPCKTHPFETDSFSETSKNVAAQLGISICSYISRIPSRSVMLFRACETDRIDEYINCVSASVEHSSPHLDGVTVWLSIGFSEIIVQRFEASFGQNTGLYCFYSSSTLSKLTSAKAQVYHIENLRL